MRYNEYNSESIKNVLWLLMSRAVAASVTVTFYYVTYEKTILKYPGQFEQTWCRQVIDDFQMQCRYRRWLYFIQVNLLLFGIDDTWSLIKPLTTG